MRVRCIVEPSTEQPGPAPPPGPRWRARNRLVGRRGSSHLDAAARRAASPLEPAPTTTFELNHRAICMARVSARPRRAGLPVSHGVAAEPGWLDRTSSIMSSARPNPAN